MKKTHLLALLLLAAGAAGAFFWWKARPAPTDQITVYGNVDLRQTPLSFRVAGRIEAMHPEEGAQVRAGEPLARLDDALYRALLAEAQGREEEARARLDELLNGLRPQEILQARAALAESRAALENAQKEFERNRRLLAEKVIADQEFVSIRAARDEAAARADSAREALDMALEGSRDERIRAGRAALQAASAAREAAAINLADAALAAPADGIIFTRVLEPGAVVGAGEPVYLLTLSGRPRVRCYLEERQLGSVRTGMAAFIETEDGTRLPATVTFISPEAEFTPKIVQTTSQRPDLVYMIRVEADASSPRLRQGQPVTVILLPDRDRKADGQTSPEGPSRD